VSGPAPAWPCPLAGLSFFLREIENAAPSEPAKGCGSVVEAPSPVVFQPSGTGDGDTSGAAPDAEAPIVSAGKAATAESSPPGANDWALEETGALDRAMCRET